MGGAAEAVSTGGPNAAAETSRGSSSRRFGRLDSSPSQHSDKDRGHLMQQDSTPCIELSVAAGDAARLSVKAVAASQHDDEDSRGRLMQQDTSTLLAPAGVASEEVEDVGHHHRIDEIKAAFDLDGGGATKAAVATAAAGTGADDEMHACNHAACAPHSFCIVAQLQRLVDSYLGGKGGADDFKQKTLKRAIM